MGRLRAWLGLRPRLGLLRRALHPHRRPCRHGEQRREERARRRAAEGAEAGLHAPSRHADQPPVLDGRRRLRLDLRHRELDRRCQRARIRPRRREQVRQRRHQALWRHGCQHVRRRCKGRRLCADVWSGRRQASAGPSRHLHALCRPRRSHHRGGLHGAADPRPDARQVGLARRGERGQRLAAAFPRRHAVPPHPRPPPGAEYVQRAHRHARAKGQPGGAAAAVVDARSDGPLRMRVRHRRHHEHAAHQRREGVGGEGLRARELTLSLLLSVLSNGALNEHIYHDAFLHTPHFFKGHPALHHVTPQLLYDQ
mmetsp:Transcript_37000/g.122052  ORF Transcript_37000/g.122052 Transcript_37000/m.122052 type:complete len:311 (+) Transcript_37000:153-1085(+)